MLNIMLALQEGLSQGAPIDDSLIIRIADGDRSALKTLFDSISGNVYGFALSLTKNQHDADDVLQETFLKVYATAASYKPQGKPMAWIFTVARNIANDKLRERARTAEFSEAWQDEINLSAIENAELKLVIKSLFKALSDEEAKIVILHAANGMKHREIADVLGLPTGTVLSKYNRAVKKLEDYARREELI